MDQANKPNSIKPPPQHNRVLQEITGPLVFQCLKCRLIVGDSFAFVTADRDLNSVVLYAKPHNIRVGTDLLWSREGVDIGSTYIMIYCNGCNLTLGKVWRTTPRKLDYIRDLYTLNLDCVMIYQLGDFIDPNSTPTDIHTLPSSRMQQISINKLKDMILILNERITTLEHTLDKRVNKTPNDSAVSSSTESSNACIVVTPRGAQDNSIETHPNHRILG